MRVWLSSLDGQVGRSVVRVLQADRVADLVNERRVAVLTRRMLETIGVTQPIVARGSGGRHRRGSTSSGSTRRRRWRGRAHEPDLPERAGRLGHFDEGAVDHRAVPRHDRAHVGLHRFADLAHRFGAVVGAAENAVFVEAVGDRGRAPDGAGEQCVDAVVAGCGNRQCLSSGPSCGTRGLSGRTRSPERPGTLRSAALLCPWARRVVCDQEANRERAQRRGRRSTEPLLDEIMPGDTQSPCPAQSAQPRASRVQRHVRPNSDVRCPTPSCQLRERDASGAQRCGQRRLGLTLARGTSEPRSGQRDVRSRPRFREACLDERRFIRLLLCTKRLQKTEQRPAVFPVAPQVLPVDRLRFGGTSSLEQDRAQRMTRRIMKLGRFGVDETVLQTNGPLEMGNRAVA